MVELKGERIGVHVGGVTESEDPDISDELAFVDHAEQTGFDSAWYPEDRLVREALTSLGALTWRTDEIDLCTGVTPIWTRNVAVMAQAWSTLYEMAGPRLRCGLGAWWDPLARKVGIDRRKPLRAMWEYCTVLDRLLDLETVTYDGEIIQVEDLKLNAIGDEFPPRDIPLYVGATGPTMNKMTGELVGTGAVRGVLLNGFIPTSYTTECVERLRTGVEKQGGSLADVDRPQVVAVSMAEDTSEAIETVRPLCTQYLGQQPHISKACGVEDLAAEIKEAVGGWPADESAVKAASELVPDDVILKMVAAGTPEQCVAQVNEYFEAGCTEPVLYPITDNPREILSTFAEYR